MLVIFFLLFFPALYARVKYSVGGVFWFAGLLYFRIFDFTSDWAFFIINLVRGTRFEDVYVENGKDYDTCVETKLLLSSRTSLLSLAPAANNFFDFSALAELFQVPPDRTCVQHPWVFCLHFRRA